MIGSLMYLTITIPDLMFAVSLASRYMERPTEQHQQVVKRVMRYLNGTTGLGILYKRRGSRNLVAYTDSDYAGNVDDRRSTSGYVFLLGEGVVAWSSKKQAVVSLSTAEAEFIAAASCACQCIWLRRILFSLDHFLDKCSQIHCDNSSAIKLSKNPILHDLVDKLELHTASSV
ncbi:secreted RxLR effector protein 161-like [Lotus japonicus]|uniref:secreted RxLR effector protein 161-like n=1 Tax=Lotus japonicus TaxID=34305 RepID=UPI00258B9311|nr:secreted RxLR effector protein 161-like [Lotus japonicus]